MNNSNRDTFDPDQLRTGMIIMPAGETCKPITLRARIAGQFFCPCECGTILECSQDGQELYCARCKAAFKTPTIEIHPIDHVVIDGMSRSAAEWMLAESNPKGGE